MGKIQPALTEQDIVCAEIPAGPCGIIVFGASGDLAGRKLFGSLCQLYSRELINEHFFLLGVGRKNFSDERFRQHVKEAIGRSDSDIPADVVHSFAEKIHYMSGDYDDESFYHGIKGKIAKLDSKHGAEGGVIFYLAVPPFLYEGIVERLGSAGLSCPEDMELRKRVRLIIEKPFGRDLRSCADLNSRIYKCFDESQIYRIDHYLGKETVQNILMFRFANTIFEPVWNRDYIDHVQITIAESLGVEHRGSYYDKTGAFRDMFQNHMLQMLSLVAMESPVSFEADSIRDEKVKLLRSIRPFDVKLLDKLLIRGQYTSGVVDSQQVGGYKEHAGVEPNSKTETYVAAKVFVDNRRWKDVPFYLRTGKRLGNKDTEIAITFKKVPHSMFVSAGLTEMPANVLVMQIQPEEGMSLSFQAKRPGSKICMATLDMAFNYKDVFKTDMPEAYQRLLLDCMLGDQTLFARYDGVETAWQLLTPVLEAWEKESARPFEYPAGVESFAQADNLIESDGRRWRSLKAI